MPTYIGHIAQVTPKSDKVNIQKLTLNDEERRRTRVMWHSVLTRGALGEVVNLTKPMIESGLGGLDRPCASLITLCSSHLGHFYGQKLPKNGHIWVHRP